jgi:hypothetical protein
VRVNVAQAMINPNLLIYFPPFVIFG